MRDVIKLSSNTHFDYESIFPQFATLIIWFNGFWKAAKIIFMLTYKGSFFERETRWTRVSSGWGVWLVTGLLCGQGGSFKDRGNLVVQNITVDSDHNAKEHNFLLVPNIINDISNFLTALFESCYWSKINCICLYTHHKFKICISTKYLTCYRYCYAK